MATVDTASLTAAIAAVNGALSTVGSLTSASPIALATVYVAAVNARAPFDAAIASLDAEIDMTDPAGVVVGAPVASAAALLAQQQILEDEAILIVTEAFLTRVGANLAGAIGPAAFAPGTQLAPAPPAQLPPPASPEPVLNLPFVLNQSVLGGPDELG